MIYTNETLELSCPAIFATQPSSELSNRYVFVPTLEILENFTKSGWELASVKQMGKSIHGIHELRFRNGELPKIGDCVLEAIVRNSHNGKSSLSIYAGLHRLSSSNRLTIPSSVFESFKVRHMGFNLSDVEELTQSFAKNFPLIKDSVHKMMETELTLEKKIQFIKKSIHLRWKSGNLPKNLDVMRILHPIREQDNKNDVWTILNVIHENFTKGGLNYISDNGRPTKLRAIKNILNLHEINIKLWELATQMCD